MKKILIGLTIVAVLISVGTVLAVGNGWSGYNYKARIFVGTGLQWCMQKTGMDMAWCEAYLGPYINDKITMKWNAEWDRGNDGNWLNPPYDAWENNEWNGKFPDGSDSVWHYKIKWIGPCGVDYTPLPDGSYCLWGQFAVLMDQGVDPSMGPGHIWFAHGIPTGYGN